MPGKIDYPYYQSSDGLTAIYYVASPTLSRDKVRFGGFEDGRNGTGFTWTTNNELKETLPNRYYYFSMPVSRTVPDSIEIHYDFNYTQKDSSLSSNRIKFFISKELKLYEYPNRGFQEDITNTLVNYTGSGAFTKNFEGTFTPSNTTIVAQGSRWEIGFIVDSTNCEILLKDLEFKFIYNK